MATSYSSLCDDFYVNMHLNTELELPDERDTILHFFECVRRKFPRMNTFYQRETGEFCLDEDRESGSYRWLTIERDRVCSGYVNPETLEATDEQHRFVLELLPYTLSVNSLDVDSLDVLFGMDFDYVGNHDEILAEALFSESPFASLLDLPGAKALGFDPSIMFGLSDDCRLQARISLESRTGAYQIRTGKYKEDDALSLSLAIRQYPDPAAAFTSIESYDKQSVLCEEIMNDRIIPHFVNPILGASGQRR
ncbi:MAG: hypothetical protein E4H40_07120 [Candidatus Brocadiia bacterium]|nr:MAG: hypothetical protein E4H40_07120 [Candidatus Brocadiia bacterium]